MQLPRNYHDLSLSGRRLVHQEYLRRQDDKCWHCGKDLYEDPAQEILDAWINVKHFPSGFFKFPRHLHHNHNTGMTIGVVHARCNAWLWQYKGE